MQFSQIIIALIPLFLIFGLIGFMLLLWNKEQPNKREDDNE